MLLCFVEVIIIVEVSIVVILMDFVVVIYIWGMFDWEVFKKIVMVENKLKDWSWLICF